jgi:hypothetical protein
MPYIEFTNPNFSRVTNKLPTFPKNFAMKSIFSDNSRVCYKPHSLPSGGIGSVRNHHAKGKRT